MMLCQIKKLIREADGFGDFPADYEDFRVEWFDIKPLSAREFEQAQQLQVAITHKATCPYFAGAQAGMRLIHEGRTFHVESVFNHKEQNRKLEMRLVERVG